MPPDAPSWLVAWGPAGAVLFAIILFLGFLVKVAGPLLTALKDNATAMTENAAAITHLGDKNATALASLAVAVTSSQTESKEQTALLRELGDLHRSPSSMFATYGMDEKLDDIQKSQDLQGEVLEAIIRQLETNGD